MEQNLLIIIEFKYAVDQKRYHEQCYRNCVVT